MKKQRGIWLQVWLFGALWGLAEATAGGLLHWIHFPWKGPVMAGIGFFLMAAAVGAAGRAWVPLCMGILAASIKMTDLVILPPPDPFWVVRPAAAILAEALLFSTALVCMGSRYEKKTLMRVSTGLLVGFSTFLLLGITGFGPRYGSFSEFLLINGTMSAGAAALLVPLGHDVGRRFSRAVLSAWISRPALLGAAAMLATVLSPVAAMVLSGR